MSTTFARSDSPRQQIHVALGNGAMNSARRYAAKRSWSLSTLAMKIGQDIGISRFVRIKEGWIQPPIVWTSVVAASGDGKDPGMRTAIRPQLLHEMKLKRENDKKNTKYEKKLVAWEGTPKPKRTDVRPKK